MRKATLGAFLVALCASVLAGAPIDLWKKGDFTPLSGGARVEGDELVLPKPGAHCARRFALKPGWRVLRLTGEMRTTDVPAGEQSWQTARIAMEWKDKDGQTVCPWPENIGWTGTTAWKDVTRSYLLPTNVTSLSVNLCNLAGGGEVRFRNFSLAITRDYFAQHGNAPLPDGVTDPESLTGAYRTASRTRTRYSLNGVWRCRPSLAGETGVPGEGDDWGWAKVPSQWSRWRPFRATSVLAPWFEDRPEDLAHIATNRAWYGRSFVMPEEARGRRVALNFEMLGSAVTVSVDGKRAGTVAYPDGELDVTAFVTPGKRHAFALDVSADAAGETVVYNESRRKVRTARAVKFQGITGNVWLDLTPSGERLDFAWAETSVARGEIVFKAETRGLEPGATSDLQATVVSLDGTDRRAFEGKGTVASDGVVSFAASWKDARLWDLDTPRNRYACRLALVKGGTVVDETVPFVFGFRDVRLAGRDLLLNGTKVHLRALYDSTQEWDSESAAYTNAVLKCRAALARGFNAMIAGNYSVSAGATMGVEEMLTASDECGFMYCFSLPHFKDFEGLETEEGQRAYREETRKVMRLARRHPSVVLWATSHNAAGYLGAGHPQRIDGLYELPPEHNGPNRAKARTCRRLIGELDPSRPCYHHESGNLDDFHCVNCYLDWSPVQERSEWLEHWATEGVKPLFFVEWGLPHVSTFSSYRGPLFIWRGNGYMSLWASEYAAAFRNDAAYEPTAETRNVLVQEERLWRTNPRGFSWGQLSRHCSSLTNNYFGIQARYAEDNWRSMRAWGITAVLPWDQGGLFNLRRTAPPVSSCTLADVRKAPGLSPDSIRPGWGDPRFYDSTAVGAVFDRWNMPDCAWIGGADKFTDKRHVYAPGETIKKTLVILNDRRRAQKVRWKAALGDMRKSGVVTVGVGERALVPVAFAAPKKAGGFELSAAFAFEGGVRQRDSFKVSVIERKTPATASVVLIDSVGKTRKEFTRLGIPFKENVTVGKGDRLVIGREALTKELFEGAVLSHIWNGGRVILFEQTKATLETLGFRVQTYGLRNVFVRDAAAGGAADLLRDELLRDWAGESTLERAYTPPVRAETSADSDTFAGYSVTRVWRNGFRGAVASVIPEKPSYGDWVPWVDGGFDLQYSPLLEWRVARGSIVFCQMDVTDRSEPDPVASALVRRLAVEDLPPIPAERGAAEAYGQLAYGATVFSPRTGDLIDPDVTRSNHSLFLVSTGAGQPPKDFAERIRNGATALLLGLDSEEIRAWSPVPLKTVAKKAALFSRIERLPPELAGLSNADWAWHGLMDFTAFADPDPEGNEAVRVVRYGKGRLVFWQVPPWAFDAERRPYLRTSRRRAAFMLSRLMGNLGFRRGPALIRYADVPVPDDDPYRYYHW